MKVIGVVQCKNEWGLIAVSITHALRNHVDEVWVIDDGSSDQSADGFRFLTTTWGDRLRVFHLDSIGFYQEAITNVLVQLALREGADWVYPFDADEFLLLRGDSTLKSLLETVDENADAVQYPVANYVSPNDFDENSITGYARQTFRAVPTKQGDIEAKEQQIRSGESTFFDFDFKDKVIFRGRPSLRLGRGSHRVERFGRKPVTVHSDALVAAHLSLLTRERLDRKAAQGKAHNDVNAPGGRGWQNRLVYDLQQEGRLDEYWEQHSVVGDDVPRFAERTEEFSAAIEPSLEFLRQQFGGDSLSVAAKKKLRSGPGTQSLIPLDTVVWLAHNLQMQATRAARTTNTDAESTGVVRPRSLKPLWGRRTR